jgi:hypothetical protein
MSLSPLLSVDVAPPELSSQRSGLDPSSAEVVSADDPRPSDSSLELSGASDVTASSLKPVSMPRPRLAAC